MFFYNLKIRKTTTHTSENLETIVEKIENIIDENYIKMLSFV